MAHILKSLLKNSCVLESILVLGKWSESEVLLAQPCLTLVTPWTAASQAHLSMGFSRQKYWNRLPLPSPGYLPDPGIKPGSPALAVDSLPSEPPGKPWCFLVKWVFFWDNGSCDPVLSFFLSKSNREVCIHAVCAQWTICGLCGLEAPHL